MEKENARKQTLEQLHERRKMDFFLWSRVAVGQLIEQEYGVNLQVRIIGKYLARWSFTPQKPIKRAYEQNPEAVQACCFTCPTAALSPIRRNASMRI